MAAEGERKEVARTEGLRHNPKYAATRSIDRITLADGSQLLRKVLQRSDPAAPAHWQASDNPRRWSYWRREADAYRSETLRESLAGTGLARPATEVDWAPDLGDTDTDTDTDTDQVTLWLEWVDGRPGTGFDLGDHRALASGLGRWQSRPPLDEPWCSQRFLRDYSGSKPVDVGLVYDDRAWAQPLVARNWDPALREGWQRLLANRERLLSVMERLPRCTTHLDVWPSNEIRRPDGEIVLVDWAFCGDGAIGEDLGNHVPDSTFDLFWPAAALPLLDQETFAAYVDGLRSEGWAGDERLVRLGVVASCVKYTWLLPLILAGASATHHAAYYQPADPDHLFTERGLGFSLLVGWCGEALGLIDQLDR